MSGRGYLVAKRTLDLLAASVGIVLTSPFLAVIAILIKTTSRGPVLYRGRRIGLHGQAFYMFKFRTMVTDAERFGTTTSLGDPRITPVGRVLRRYKLDELPQLFNIIRGEMSLVGPRPEVQEHTDEYTAEERDILSVVPGITDYSSIRFASLDEVLGSENAHEVFVTKYRAEKNALRLEYVRNRSFMEDLRILGRTLVAIARKARPS